eukprot:6207571-Pleurochrysis_carterae.AAC.1
MHAVQWHAQGLLGIARTIQARAAQASTALRCTRRSRLCDVFRAECSTRHFKGGNCYLVPIPY